MFESVLINNAASTLGIRSAALCTGASLLFGLIIAVCYYISGKSTKGICISLIMLPALVQTVIMLVNGNLGAGVAIVGAFSLVRFRSIPGTSREITCVFFAASDRSINNSKCPVITFAAKLSASCAFMLPSVQTSIVSLS